MTWLIIVSAIFLAFAIGAGERRRSDADTAVLAALATQEHRVSVLRNGWKSTNIHASSGAIRGIPV